MHEDGIGSARNRSLIKLTLQSLLAMALYLYLTTGQFVLSAAVGHRRSCLPQAVTQFACLGTLYMPIAPNSCRSACEFCVHTFFYPTVTTGLFLGSIELGQLPKTNEHRTGQSPLDLRVSTLLLFWTLVIFWMHIASKW